MVIGLAIVTLTLHVEVLPQASVAVHVIIERPALKLPLALPPDPLRVVAPLTVYARVTVPAQLSVAVACGIV